MRLNKANIIIRKQWQANSRTCTNFEQLSVHTYRLDSFHFNETVTEFEKLFIQ